MRIVAISILGLVTLSGCMSLHAHLPEDVIRHMAREDGIELSAVCSHEGQSYSEGAIACMDGQRASCDETGRWILSGACQGGGGA